ncbi:MAG: NAD(P)/FAD-dependent oxidoreductase [Nitrospiraceae bacterium]|nr:NAD(P)/FAD-dependent oxidoreductase [Nitrospiraceae bacterium]
MPENISYDVIIIGGGPGGLQAAIYLGRFNRKVLLIDRTGGRTAHARSIENFLTHEAISGAEIISRGLAQAERFRVRVLRDTVSKVEKQGAFFQVTAGGTVYEGRFVIAASGVTDNFPPIENYHRFLGTSFFTCVDCDGYKTTGRKLLVIGNSINSVRLAFGMKQMFTKDITLNLIHYDPPPEYLALLSEEGIPLVKGTPVRIIGNDRPEAVELKNGDRIPCEAIMSNFGYRLNDAFLEGLPLKKDANGFKYAVSGYYESSLAGLFIVGPLNTGNDQVVIAAGEGAVAAIEINKRLLDL